LLVQAEERRSARLGREDDRRAEEEELREQEEKRKKKKRARATGGLVMWETRIKVYIWQRLEGQSQH